MAIITPSENTYYCIGSGSATWFVNNNQLISFNQSDLINGTKFVKQNVNGSAFKITWDGGGSGKEHIINNPDNYSYSVIDGYINEQTITLSGSYHNRNVVYTAPTGYQIINFNSSGSYRFGSNPSTYPLVNKWYGIKAAISDIDQWGIVDNVQVSSSGTRGYSMIEYYQKKTLLPRYSINQIWDSNYGDNLGTLTINVVIAQAQKLIRIIDNNITYTYPITNTNSVEIIYSQGGVKYTFSANMQSISQTYQTTQIIALKCGLDCPPDSCVKCRDGDFVCCYGDNGTVIERIYDPNFEVEAC